MSAEDEVRILVGGGLFGRFADDLHRFMGEMSHPTAASVEPAADSPAGTARRLAAGQSIRTPGLRM